MSNSAKITQSSGAAVEFKEIDGLFSCLLKHKVSETAAEFKYTGPKITPAVWNEVLAFFKWTYDTEKSESQVRLFVHPVHGWMAWAFPQKGGTGMTIKEIPEHERFISDRATKIPDGYVAWGTVHHHCSMSAFQSGTDEADEKTVEGIHITVGKMDCTRYDLHCRMYYKGHKFEPDMSAFWDVGDECMAKAKELEEFFGITVSLDEQARLQMRIPAPNDTPVNQLWKDNYIVTRQVWQQGTGEYWNYQYGRGGKTYCGYCRVMTDHEWANCPERTKAPTANQPPPPPIKIDVQNQGDGMTKKERKKLKGYRMNRDATQLFRDILSVALASNYVAEEVVDVINTLYLNNDMALHEIIFRELADSTVTFDDLFKVVPTQGELVQMELEEDKRLAIEAAKGLAVTSSQATDETGQQPAGGPVTGWEGYGGC